MTKLLLLNSQWKRKTGGYCSSSSCSVSSAEITIVANVVIGTAISHLHPLINWHSHLVDGCGRKSDVAVWAAKFATDTATWEMAEAGKVMWLCELQTLQLTQPPGRWLRPEKWCGCVSCKVCNWHSHLGDGSWQKRDVAVWAANFATDTATWEMAEAGKGMWLCELQSLQLTQPPGRWVMAEKWCGCVSCKLCNWHSHLVDGWGRKSDVAVWAAKFATDTATWEMAEARKVMWLCELQSLQLTQPPGRWLRPEKWCGCVSCKLCNWHRHLVDGSWQKSDVAVWAANFATDTATVKIRDILMDHQKHWYSCPHYKTCSLYSPKTFLIIPKGLPRQCYVTGTYPPNFMILCQYEPKLCLLPLIPHVSCV